MLATGLDANQCIKARRALGKDSRNSTLARAVLPGVSGRSGCQRVCLGAERSLQSPDPMSDNDTKRTCRSSSISMRRRRLTAGDE